jgi:hypothetical protein
MYKIYILIFITFVFILKIYNTLLHLQKNDDTFSNFKVKVPITYNDILNLNNNSVNSDINNNYFYKKLYNNGSCSAKIVKFDSNRKSKICNCDSGIYSSKKFPNGFCSKNDNVLL